LNLNEDGSPHDALGDILVLEALFKRIYAKIIEDIANDSINKMIDVTNNTALLVRMPFGKHKKHTEH
jgi:hypothetical protein